ncbi:MAG: KpsF/GutQ family sugar-phosphate isomerase [Phycisphaeraceae bacterium]|nr:KpsF/GutQ family sugar-phosphate isomerase [Phycisphaeraceae bacterium]
MNKARGEPAAVPEQTQREFAQGVLRAEADAVARVLIDEAFDRAVDLILERTGNTAQTGSGAVVVTGLGKSHFIGQKLSATFASTGTPSHFLYPTEAMHGDLGRVRAVDVVLALSYSGNTEEIVALATLLRQDGVPVIAITGKQACDLGRLAAVTLCIGDVTEACPLNLAPTASTTAMLALGDALALCVSRRRNFGIEDFKKVHPGGGLGRHLMPVTEAMRLHAGKNLPLIQPEMTIEQAYAYAGEFSKGGRRVGAMIIVHPDGTLAGLFTDGDLRNTFIKHGLSSWQQPIGRFMTRNPRVLTHAALVRDAVQMVREFRFDEIPVVDETGKVLGLIDVLDLMALKVIEG